MPVVEALQFVMTSDGSTVMAPHCTAVGAAEGTLLGLTVGVVGASVGEAVGLAVGKSLSS